MLLSSAEVTHMILNAQTKWSWEHALYLFLGGLGGATFVMGVIADFAARGADETAGVWLALAKIGMIAGIICLGLGLLILLFDLGKPLNAIHAFKRPSTSWISRGIIIVIIFGVLALIQIAWIWPVTAESEPNAARSFFGILALIFGLGVAVYTGFLLGASRPIATWSTPLTPAIFLLSALYGGTLLLQFLGSFLTTDLAAQPLECLGSLAIILSIMLLFMFWFYVIANNSSQGARAGSKLLVSGNVSGLFWFGVVFVGLLIPLALEFIAIFMVADAPSIMYLIAGICGILGVLFMRQAILAAGVHAPLRASVFEYPVPHM